MTTREAMWLLVGIATGLAVSGVLAWYFAVPLGDTTRAVLATLGVALLAQGLALILGEARATRDRMNARADAGEQRNRDRQDKISERLRQDDLERVRETREWAFAGIDRCAALLDGNAEAAVAESARARALVNASPLTFGSTNLQAEFEAVLHAVRVIAKDMSASPAGPAILEPIVADLKSAMLGLRDDVARALDEQRVRVQRGDPLRSEPSPEPDQVKSRIMELIHQRP